MVLVWLLLCFLVRCLGNFDLIFILIPLLTDNVTHSSGNAGKKKSDSLALESEMTTRNHPIGRATAHHMLLVKLEVNKGGRKSLSGRSPFCQH